MPQKYRSNAMHGLVHGAAHEACFCAVQEALDVVAEQHQGNPEAAKLVEELTASVGDYLGQIDELSENEGARH